MSDDIDVEREIARTSVEIEAMISNNEVAAISCVIVGHDGSIRELAVFKKGSQFTLIAAMAVSYAALIEKARHPELP